MSDTSTPPNKPKAQPPKMAESPKARAERAYEVIKRMTEINGKLRQMGVTSSGFAIKKAVSR